MAIAFDGQAAAFERAPIQSDPRLLAHLVDVADVPAGRLVLDAGCGPGLLAEAFLVDPRGYRVLGCDLSAEMVARASARCASAGLRAEFVRSPVILIAGEIAAGRRPPVGACVTRFVLHHLPDPADFVSGLVAALRASGGGVLLVADHLADVDAGPAGWHRRVEVMRDRTHTRNLTGGELVDLLSAEGAGAITYSERPYRHRLRRVVRARDPVGRPRGVLRAAHGAGGTPLPRVAGGAAARSAERDDARRAGHRARRRRPVSTPVMVRGRDLPAALERLEAAPAALLAIGRPVCPACRMLPASLAAVAVARPGLALCVADMVTPEDWAVREAALWPRGIRVSPASVPALALFRDGVVVATRQGGAPAHLLDAWLAERLGPAAHPPAAEVTVEERAVLAATAARRAWHRAVRER